VRLVLLAAMALGLAACDVSQPYSGVAETNMQVRTNVTSGRIALDVMSVSNRCETAYLGYVALDRPVVEIGLPVGRPSLLVFQFEGKGNTPIKKEVQVTPRTGNRYEATVTYKASIYDIELREIDPRAGTYHELDGRRRC
jgi:hypothetical protein